MKSRHRARSRLNPFPARIPHSVAVPGVASSVAMPRLRSFPQGDQSWSYLLVAWNEEPVSFMRYCRTLRMARGMAQRWLYDGRCEHVEICIRGTLSTSHEVWSLE